MRLCQPYANPTPLMEAPRNGPLSRPSCRVRGCPHQTGHRLGPLHVSKGVLRNRQHWEIPPRYQVRISWAFANS